MSRRPSTFISTITIDQTKDAALPPAYSSHEQQRVEPHLDGVNYLKSELQQAYLTQAGLRLRILDLENLGSQIKTGKGVESFEFEDNHITSRARKFRPPPQIYPITDGGAVLLSRKEYEWFKRRTDPGPLFNTVVPALVFLVIMAGAVFVIVMVAFTVR